MKYLMNMMVLLSLFSCAQQRVILEKERLVPYEEFRETTYLPFSTLPVKLEAVSDNRAVHEVAGEARTGGQFTRTPVYFEKPLLDTARDYLRNELKKRNVLMVEENHEVVLNIMIQQFWVEELQERYQPEKAKCQIALELNAIKGKDQYNGKLWSEVISPGDLGDATEKLAPTMASCLNVAVEKIVNDKKFIEFIRRKNGA